MTLQIKTIEQVIEELTSIIEVSKNEHSRLGYFAALYRKVTIKVKEGIENGYFDDGPRMERLDVIFACRYLDAYKSFVNKQPVSKSWQFAFDNSSRLWLIVLQHLLLGMNAHINLDLGLAAAQTVSRENLEELKGDFNKINGILASLVGEVQQELSLIWLPLKFINKLLGNVEEAIINFSMTKARDEAWKVAVEFSSIAQENYLQKVNELDKKVADFASVIRSPGLLSVLLKIVRLMEKWTIKKKIEILE